MADFKTLKQNVGIEEVATNYLKLPLTVVKGKLWGACPSCDPANEMGMFITPEVGMFQCVKTKKGGDIIYLVAHQKKVSLKMAGDMLAEVYMNPKQRTKTLAVVEQVPVVEEKEPEVLHAVAEASAPAIITEENGDVIELSQDDYYVLKELRNLDFAHELVEQLGIAEIVAELVGIGYCYNGLMRHRLVIPIRLKDGTLVAYFGIAAEGIEHVKVPKVFHIPMLRRPS